MGIVNWLFEWTKNIFAPLGSLGLFLLAFIESIFFPVPPDILLILLVINKPEAFLWYALVCTLGSVFGAVFGYAIGRHLGQPILERLFSKKRIDRVHRLFEKYEAWAIGIAGFTPIPYKVFTTSAGAFYVNFPVFIFASLISRGLRFFIIASVIAFFGQPAISFIDKNFGLTTIIISAIAVLSYLAYKRYAEKISKWI